MKDAVEAAYEAMIYELALRTIGSPEEAPSFSFIGLSKPRLQRAAESLGGWLYFDEGGQCYLGRLEQITDEAISTSLTELVLSTMWPQFGAGDFLMGESFYVRAAMASAIAAEQEKESAVFCFSTINWRLTNACVRRAVELLRLRGFDAQASDRKVLIHIESLHVC